MIASALVLVVLLQRSEGGALGMGGSGQAGGFLTGRGTANLLTRTTAALAAAFFTTSILLTLIAQQTAPKRSLIDATSPPAATSPASPAAPGAAGAPAGDAPRGGILDKLQEPRVPQSR
jgi:preprotein translocase subunit SecG